MKTTRLIWLALCLFTWPLAAQQTATYADLLANFEKAEQLFEQGVFAEAAEVYQQVLKTPRPPEAGMYEQLQKRSELGYAKCMVRLHLPQGEILMLDFIGRNAPDPIADQALIELANFYFNAKDYQKAVTYFSRIPGYQLSPEQRAEVRFKMGYAFFVKKKFSAARENFRMVKNLEKTKWYYPTNYYYGLCAFFQGDYEDAVKSFRIAEKSRRYKAHIPYYISQIYFAQGKYQALIDYAEPKLQDGRVRKQNELHQIVGQAYFELGDYDKALPLLEYYAERSGRMKEEEFYQLAYTQYQVGKYESAARNFEELADVDSKLGQYALYYLADCYLKLHKKSQARAALAKAKNMNYEPEIREEALFNYAKLSYELGFDRAALTALQSIPPGSHHYEEALSLLSDVFLKTNDYAKALQLIQDLPAKTPKLREALQKVAYLHGLQLYREGQFEEARQAFILSNSEPVKLDIKASCLYWLADILHREQRYEESIKLLNQYFILAQAQSKLPDESSIFMGHYTQGYNYLKLENYAQAGKEFEEARSGIRRNRPFISNLYIKDKVLGDATLRAADCYFKRNRYNEAITYYDEAVKNKYPGFVYALYQKALIEGLRGHTTNKILALEDIVEKYPDSPYADDALFSLGVTYHEIGQLNKAITPLRKLVNDYRDKSDLVVQAYLRLGLISFNQGNLQTAIEYYKQVFAHNPSPQEANDALVALEEIYVENLGDPDGYFRFLQTIPGYEVDSYAQDSLNFKSAESQYLNGEYSRAVDAFTSYLRKFPNGRNRLQAHFHRGISYFELKQYDAALEDFDWVIQRGQNRYYAQSLELAALIAYNHKRDYHKSYEYFSAWEQVAESEEDRYKAQLGALQSAYRTNNVSAVYEMANKVANNPQATPEQKAIANFYIGKIAYDNKDFEAARSAFEDVISLSNEDEAAEARYLIASILYQQRKLTECEAFCNKAIQEMSGYDDWIARTLIVLSDTYADMGDLLSARAVLEAILEGYHGEQEIIDEAKAKLDKLNAAAASGSRIDAGDDFMLEDEN